MYRIDRDSLGEFRSRTFADRYQYRSRKAALPRSVPKSGFGRVPGSKLHPSLLPLLGGSPDSVIHLIVSFRDSIPIPVFPRPHTNQPRTSPGNGLVRHQADSLISVLRGLRAMRYAEDSTSLIMIPSVVVRGRFWLIQAMVVDASVGNLLAIDSMRSVTYVRPVNAGERPPSRCPDGVDDARCTDDDSANDPAAALELIGGEDWKASAFAQGWIGVLDTGVNTDHVLLKDVFATVNVFQCEHNCPVECPEDLEKCTDCDVGNPGDLCEEGHGTATAGILVGTNEEFPRHQGMTRASLDWYTVYEQDCDGDCDAGTGTATLNACAAVRAIEFAIRRGNSVIIAEVAAEDDADDDRDPIDRAAAHAFDAGKAVIAAAGNSPDAGSVTGPAREATVIGAGARYLYEWVADTNKRPFQRYGTVNGRYKPELLGPTKTEAPARCSDHAFTFYSYTSGATPYVGGAASVLNEWLAKTIKTTDPGQTYAQLIVSGSLTGPFTNAKCGVGLLGVAPFSSLSWVGKAELESGEESRIDLPDATDDLVTVEAALWWPEPEQADGTRPHHQVKLEILDASGNSVASSSDANNVFQRLSVPRSSLGALGGTTIRWKWLHFCVFWGWFCFSLPIPVFETQTWSIRITEQTSMAETEVQTVYWSVVGRK